MNCRTSREISHYLRPVVDYHGPVLADHIVPPVHEQIREPPFLVSLETDSFLSFPITNSQLHIDSSTPLFNHVRCHSSCYVLTYEHTTTSSSDTPLPALETRQLLPLLSTDQFTTSHRLFNTLYKTSNLPTQYTTTNNNQVNRTLYMARRFSEIPQGTR